jgi:hypothetical protein
VTVAVSFLFPPTSDACPQISDTGQHCQWHGRLLYPVTALL